MKVLKEIKSINVGTKPPLPFHRCRGVVSIMWTASLPVKIFSDQEMIVDLTDSDHNFSKYIAKFVENT